MSGVSPGVRHMAAAAFWFSVMTLLVKAAGRTLPSQEIVLVRGLITLGLSWAALRAAGVPLWGNDRTLLVTRGIVGFISLSCHYYAVVHLALADATVIQFTNPVFAALLAVPVLGERTDRRDAAALLVSLAGVVLVARPGFLFGQATRSLDPLAVAVALAGAVFAAAAYVGVRRMRGTEDARVIVFYFALIASLGALPGTIPVFRWPTGPEWLLLLGVGIVAQIGQIHLTHGLHLERTGRATTVGYLQIVFAGIWGALFFREIPGPFSLAGAALIVGSTVALARRSAPATAEAEEAA